MIRAVPIHARLIRIDFIHRGHLAHEIYAVPGTCGRWLTDKDRLAVCPLVQLAIDAAIRP